MPCLVLDTSSDLCLVGLIKENQVVDEIAFAHQNLLSKTLLPTIETLLDKNGLKPKELQEIAVGIGPGSYTGTRLGASVGKALSFALDLPLKVFPSPLAFLPQQQGRFAFLLPTRFNTTFLLKGISSPSTLTCHLSALIPSHELESHLQDTDFALSSLAAPNLPNLALFLAHAEPIPPENAELLYLHTPF